jgi:hypothetical protein
MRIFVQILMLLLATVALIGSSMPVAQTQAADSLQVIKKEMVNTKRT